MDVLSETATNGALRTIDDIRRVGSVENTCIMGSDLVYNVLAWGVTRGSGGRYRVVVDTCPRIDQRMSKR